MVHVTKIDPSLWRGLEALLSEKNVTRAAARVGLTQSAMSRVLARLRADLGDPLLVRSGRALLLTPRAEAMAPRLRSALGLVDEALAERRAFDPATTARVFALTTADYGVAVVVAPVVAAIAREAPHVSVIVEPVRADFEEALQLGTLDAALLPMRKSGGSLVWTKLRSEPFVSLVREDHPRVGARLDLETFCALPHVVVSPERRAGNVVDELLGARGRSRHVALRVSSFIAAPLVVAESDMILTAPESIARRFATALRLRVLEPPLRIGPLRLAMAWHERQRRDPGHTWLRRTIVRAASR